MDQMMVEFSEVIADGDHMVTASLEAYFRTARAGLASVMDGIERAGKPADDIKYVLDFGCGYGRVYRTLVAAFPNAQTTACDLMEGAARFCAETFGGDWVKSHEDLAQVKLPYQYDLVWLGSVFTHLPEHRWNSLLDFLASVTRKDGVVVFTTHGARAIEHLETFTLLRNPHLIPAKAFADMKEQLPSDGFKFVASAPGNHRHQVDKLGMDVTLGEYGFSFATEKWIETLIDGLPDWRLAGYVPGGWGNNHDVATIVRL